MTKQITETPSTRSSATSSAKPNGRPKAETLRKLLSRRNGATLAQVQKELGWQPHTVRAAISRLRSSGLPISLDRSGKVARYRAVSGEEGQ